jgi:hypothetical protein
MWLAAVLVAVGPAAHATTVAAPAPSGQAQLASAAHGNDVAVVSGAGRHAPRSGLRLVDAVPGGAPAAVAIAVTWQAASPPLLARPSSRPAPRALGARAPPRR